MRDIHFYVADEHYEKLKERAQKKGLGLSSYIRSLVIRRTSLNRQKRCIRA